MMLPGIICYVADGEKLDHDDSENNNNPDNNGTANPITEHSVSIVTDVISSRMPVYILMEEQVQVMKIARHSLQLRIITQ